MDPTRLSRSSMIHLIQKTEVWTLTWQGWIVAAIALCLLIIVGAYCIHPFLAVTQPIDAMVAIVEGWIPDEFLEAIVDDLHRYQLVITTGFPVNYGRYLTGYDDFAQVASGYAGHAWSASRTGDPCSTGRR